MAIVPKFKLYDSTGVSLLFTFPAVQNTNLPLSNRDTIVHTNLRAAGGVVIDGGLKPFDAFIDFVIFGDDYEEVTAVMEDLEDIEINVPYLIRIDKTISTYFEYKVKRLVPYDWQNVEVDLRNNRQRVRATFLANSW